MGELLRIGVGGGALLFLLGLICIFTVHIDGSFCEFLGIEVLPTTGTSADPSSTLLTTPTYRLIT